jgi:benzoyl-CoA reductase/2-hydroxyglutaryl-CoA dehydratase subunit BcrC/BadD/HgdB
MYQISIIVFKTILFLVIIAVPIIKLEKVKKKLRQLESEQNEEWELIEEIRELDDDNKSIKRICFIWRSKKIKINYINK